MSRHSKWVSDTGQGIVYRSVTQDHNNLKSVGQEHGTTVSMHGKWASDTGQSTVYGSVTQDLCQGRNEKWARDIRLQYRECVRDTGIVSRNKSGSKLLDYNNKALLTDQWQRHCQWFFFTCASRVLYSQFLLWDSHFKSHPVPGLTVIMENYVMDAMIF